jgi:hypothetical protein
MQDPKIGGFLITFPSGLSKEVVWQSAVPAPDPLRAAKEFTAGVLQQLLEEQRQDDIDRTNWVSVTAAVQKIVKDFGAKRLEALRALEVPGINSTPISALKH